MQLARKTIMERLGVPVPNDMNENLKTIPADAHLQQHRGTFVTLKLHDNLRGCIGNIEARDSIDDSVKRNAGNAAFHDFRFRPLTKEELSEVEIEVSILTTPKELEYKDANDLKAKLRPNIDGVIIQKGAASATFLPQVWEQLPNVDLFLSHLCQKAGIGSTAWKTDKLIVHTYQVQYFEEH
ncbi:MAG: AmmeMemoRadiSam system protein A [Desulfobacterales bacterium]|nr:AmmeMemoRadiSam system protein A [Desulfobacterales bacterium]